MGPFLPNCRFKGFFILVHASLKMHLFFKAVYKNSGHHSTFHLPNDIKGTILNFSFDNAAKYKAKNHFPICTIIIFHNKVPK